MACQILFSGKSKKHIINLSSAELAQSIVKSNSMTSVLMENGHTLGTVTLSNLLLLPFCTAVYSTSLNRKNFLPLGASAFLLE